MEAHFSFETGLKACRSFPSFAKRPPVNPMSRYVPLPGRTLFLARGHRGIFVRSRWAVSQRSDRMAYRLEGQPYNTLKGNDIVSDGAAFGAIQIPATARHWC